MLDIEKDPRWMAILLFFARLNKHGHGEKASMALLGAIRDLGGKCGVDNEYLADLIEHFCNLHFVDEIKDMWFKELERKDDEAVH